MFITGHANHDARTLISYYDGKVTVKVTDTTPYIDPFVHSIPLAQFLRDIGIPFKAVQEVTSTAEPVAVVPGD